MSDLDRMIAVIRNSEMLRLCLVAGLTLVLLVPVVMIGGLVSERQERYEEAVSTVSAMWGEPQTLTGPFLVVPYEVDVSPGSSEDDVRTLTRYAVFLPGELDVTGRVATDQRTRGIFTIPVYTLDARFDGRFDPPNVEELGIDPSRVFWARARLVLGISDVRAIGNESTLVWNDQETRFLPGTPDFDLTDAGIHARLPLDPESAAFTFSFSLALDGSRGAWFGPYARETSVHLTSDSAYPEFGGNWLPDERTVTDSGFDADWQVSHLGRNYPQAWVSGTDLRGEIEDSRFGVELGGPPDHYRMSERSVKYAGLFILLTFSLVWLAEVLARRRVHPIQYLMLGAALCIFYLLELSLAEHIGFTLAYALASLAIVAMVGVYSRTMFPETRRAALVLLGVSSLYGFLFILLINEDAALLVGSIGLFVVLAAIMFATRRIDWSGARIEPGAAVDRGS